MGVIKLVSKMPKLLMFVIFTLSIYISSNPLHVQSHYNIYDQNFIKLIPGTLFLYLSHSNSNLLRDWWRILCYFSSPLGCILVRLWSRFKKHQLEASRILIPNEPKKFKNYSQFHVRSISWLTLAKIFYNWGCIFQRLVWLYFPLKKIKSQITFTKRAARNCKWRLGRKWWGCLLLWWYPRSIHFRYEFLSKLTWLSSKNWMGYR